jgi:hypothetical protein
LKSIVPKTVHQFHAMYNGRKEVTAARNTVPKTFVYGTICSMIGA